jgi:predicted  nucleic acid-binding Zn-ribbon protein
VKAVIDKDELNDLLREASALQHLHGRVDDAAKTIGEAKASASSRAEALAKELASFVERLRASEVELEQRLAAAETSFSQRLDAIRAQSAANSTTWRAPFALLAFVCFALASAWAYQVLVRPKKFRLD